MRAGTEFPEGGFLPPQYSPQDLFDEGWNEAKVHLVTLMAGDCLYVPAHWWVQTASSLEERTIVVNHWYESSSSWADIIMDGISANKL